MKKAAAHPTTKTPNDPAPAGGSLHIGREFLDTTWRIAVPVVGMTLLGILGDKRLGSKPWLTLLGSLIGFVCAGLLIRRQINSPRDDGDAGADRRGPA